ncbi:Dicer-like protein 1 [Marasmius tenuissimus]|nr:Dicer-like protein 1 [Marasmius tenuissimus]
MASAELVPRQYQEEIFVQAQRENVIAALGTGSGKTYISTLLIKWIATQEISRGRAVVFLVPKVPLVEQQGEFIAKHTTLRVAKLHGESAHELTNRKGWEKTFAKNDVLVMTAQIFLNLITHSLWSINKVSLLVFDECHHTRKNHPYNGIMREYMLVPEEERPKVFGLTASPIQNAKNPIDSLNELQMNMNARVIGVLDNVAELTKHTPKPIEVIKEYTLPPETYDFPEPSLFDCLNVFDPTTIKVISDIWVDIERRYYVTRESLGPYCASLYLFSEVKRAILALGQLESRKDIDPDLIVQRAPVDQEIPLDLLEMIDILLEYEGFFTSLDSSPSLPLTVPISWVTPKVKVLVDVLAAHYSSTFQGIIFVDQRQVAACLAKVLPHVIGLEGLLQCGEVVGNNSDRNDMTKNNPASGTGNPPADTLKLFRDGVLNLLIATSVAEEGLDFPACDLVIRFDPLQHMVGYIQSRGRARNKISKFIIMLPEGDSVSLSRYHAFTSAESELRNIYSTFHQPGPVEADTDEFDVVDPVDLAERERFVVPSTSAFVNYDNSITLIEHLCSLIPHDLYTPPHAPVYTGDFQATLDLPPSLPLTPGDLSYEGPVKHSKKEAKRAVAFIAVKRLYELEVFDEYLLPVSSQDSKDSDDHVLAAILRTSGGGKKIRVMLDVLTRDPWMIGERLWIHPVYSGGALLAGLVTGTRLPPSKVFVGGVNVEFEVGAPCPVQVDEETDDDIEDEEDVHYRKDMEEYTRLSLSIQISGAELEGPPNVYLVPLTTSLTPDFHAIRRLLSSPKGHLDWTGVNDSSYGKLLLRNFNQQGRTLLLHNIREDLTPMSTPVPESREAEVGSPTYHDYYTNRWTRRNNRAGWTPFVPTEGPMIEVSRVAFSTAGSYKLDSVGTDSGPHAPGELEIQVMPQRCCAWLDISPSMALAYKAFPVLCQRLTDVYRAREARFALSLPPIQDDVLIQALTIPVASGTFNNQRLETLGDAVLELCTTVHLLNKFPHKHEGQLSSLRQKYIGNKFLCLRALDIGLERFISAELHKHNRGWRYVEEDTAREVRGGRVVKRKIPRRSLQDCMEAILGASFVTGGISMALHTGVSLGLNFGGVTPWRLRYETSEDPVPPMFADLEETLGYRFRNGKILKEAVTHPSFSSYADTGTYQRLEFLGDAILDLVVIHYLYKKFPDANSHQLALPRTKAICSPALASLAVRRLNVHKLMLVNNTELSVAISQYVPALQLATAEIIVRDGWRYDPPKALSDVFESVVGAVLVDSEYNYERTAVVVEDLMGDLLELLSPSVCRDPVSILHEWVSGNKCLQKVGFRRGTRDGWEGIEAHLHGIVLAGPIVSTSSSIAKHLAAERAFSFLQDPADERALAKICDCRQAEAKTLPKTTTSPPSKVVHDATDSPRGDVEDSSSLTRCPALAQ